MIVIPVSAGELLDKISILRIKRERIAVAEKLKNIKYELALLEKASQQFTDLKEQISQLKKVNEKLWEIEDEIRDCERRKDFGPRFIELARAVYITNDERSRLKREINEKFNSAIQEEKSYQEFIL